MTQWVPKIDFWPFLKLQKMELIYLSSLIRLAWNFFNFSGPLFASIGFCGVIFQLNNIVQSPYDILIQKMYLEFILTPIFHILWVILLPLDLLNRRNFSIPPDDL